MIGLPHAVILDLENAVAPAAEPEARERVCDLARRNADRELFGSREVTVRVNARGSEWHDADLAAVARAGPERLAAECRQGRRLGFDGKTLIHPGQLETANATFAPSPEQVGHARRVIEAFEEAEAAGSGVVTVDGVMVENLHVRTARRVLALDRAIAER